MRKHNLKTDDLLVAQHKTNDKREQQQESLLPYRKATPEKIRA